MELPAVSQTRIEFWKTPQFTQNGMWWFTLFFGFFGLHHLLLRSPQTTILFAIVNMMSFGYLWFYDLIQLSSSGGNDTNSLNTYGLAHPWGPLGLAQGLWMTPEEAEAKQKEPASEEGPPSPWWFSPMLFSSPYPL